ncbi:MAG: hypothetical protein DMD56_00355 [Gemmatimonadetes bacterium]|nr:MAG: hypothetical protein DMD56_00355 [Gemmatimonadota bacterium]
MEPSSSARTGIVTWAPVALALGLVAASTLVPMPTHGMRGDEIPFFCLGCGDYALADAVANVVLFVPLGWALSRAGLRAYLALAVALTTTIGVEWLQHGFIPGRVASMSDILTNALGGAVGIALPGLRRRVVEAPRRARRVAIGYSVLLVACLGVGMAMQAVPLPRTLQWTEGSTDTTQYVPFTGSLNAVRVDGVPATMHQWLDVPDQQAVEIAVDLLSGRPDTGLAQIVVAWLPSGPGWMWLEQRDRDLHLHLASASDRARLRGHSVWLRHAMPVMAGEPVGIRLFVRSFSYRIVIVTNVGTVIREARLGPGDAWRLFTPTERATGSWTRLLTAGWMAVLLWPLGYLTSVSSRGALVVASVGTGVILAVLPIVSGCAGLPLLGWCGAASGLLGGSQRRAVASLRRP